MIPQIHKDFYSEKQLDVIVKYLMEGYKYGNIRNVTVNNRNYIVAVLEKDGELLGVNSKGGTGGAAVERGKENHVRLRNALEQMFEKNK